MPNLFNWTTQFRTSGAEYLCTDTICTKIYSITYYLYKLEN